MIPVDRRENRPPDDWEDEELEEDVHAFADRHGRFSDRIERFLMQLVLLGLVALVLVQTLQLFPTFRRMANMVEALEGIPYSQVTAWQEAAPAGSPGVSPSVTPSVTPAEGSLQTMTLTIVLLNRRSAPEATLLVDGQPVAAFQAATVQVVVQPGQSLAIDGSRVAEPLTFRVVSATGILTPEPGTTVTTRGDRQNLGQIKPER